MSNALTKILKLSAIFFVVGFFFFASAHSASAATKYWTGTGTWNAANTNWGTAPGGPYNTTFDTGDAAVFEGTAGTVTVSSPNNPATITFNVTGYTLSGGTITNTSGGFTIYVANGVSATVSSLINPNTTWAAGVVSGTGTLTLSGNSTFAGSFYLYSGVTVVVSNAGALGTSANPTYVQSGATLDINGYALSEPLELIGTGVSGAGALTNSGGSQLNYAGLITLGGSATINSPNASGGIGLTNVGTITGSGYDLTFDGAATNVQISSIIGTGTGKVYKTGTGTVTFYSNSTYTGGFYLLNGTAKTQNSGTDFGDGTIYMGDTSGSNSVIFTHSGQHVVNPINIVSGSSGTKTINMAVSGGTSTWSGGFVLNDNVTLNVATGSSGFSVTGGITGTGNFTVTGSGLNQTFSTNPVNMSGVFTNSSSSRSTISGGVGSNVTGITSNGAGVINISTNALTVNSSGTTLINSNSGIGKFITVSGGVTGTGDLIIKNNNTLASAINFTASVNNTGKIINSGTGSGGITFNSLGTIGTNVTEINQNSTTSLLNVPAVTVGATGKIFRNTAGTKTLTIRGGVTGTGNITIANDSNLAAGVTLSTAALNNIGTVTNSGTGSGTATISFAIGSNVTNLIQNSTTSALNLSTVNTNQQLTIYAGAVNCTTTASCVGSGNITLGNTTGTDSASLLVGTTGLTIARPIVLATNATAGTLSIGTTTAIAAVTFSGGVTGTNNLTINNGSSTGTVTLSTATINNVGTITNTGASSGTTTISSTIGTNVTALIENSTTSAFTVSGAETVGATGKIFRNSSGTKILTISGGVTGTGDVILDNDSTLADGVTVSTAAFNNIGTVTNSGSGTGTGTISFAIGSNVTNVIQNSTTSALNLSTANSNQQLAIKAGTVNVSGNAGAVGAGNITLGDTTGSNAASLLVTGGGLTIARPVILATNASVGTLTLGNSGAAISTIFSGGVTGTNNFTINEDGTTGTVTFSTASINNVGTVTNVGAGSGTTTISGGIGANVTEVIQNSTTAAMTISGAIAVNSTSTTLKNSAGTSVLTVTGGVSGTGNLILSNDSSTNDGISITTTSVNNTGTVTNQGSGSGTATVSAIIGTNVTGVTQNSTTSALNLSGVNTFNSGTGLSIKAGTVNCTTSASCVGAQNINLGDITGSNAASLLVGSNLTIARPVILATNASVGTLTLGNSGAGISAVFSGGVTGTNNLTINENGTTGTITFSTATINNTGTVTNIGAGSGTTTISGGIGSNVTSVIENSATSTLAFGATTTISGSLVLTLGTISDGGNNLSMASFSSSNTNTRTLTMGSATVWTLTGTGTVWDTGTTTNLTLTPSTSTIKLTDTSSSSKTFAGGGKTFNNLWIAGGTGTGAYTISGSNTFADFKDDGTGAHNVNFTAGSTTTITSLTLDTTGPDLITLASTTPTTQWNLVDTAGTNTVQYVSITDSCASGGATWVASDASNVNGGNNCGWTFPALSVSGTANGNDGATVKIAINGSIDAHTATIASSAWSIANISSLSANDIITVWVDGVTDANETTAITKYSSGATITGMVLNTNVLTIGSNQNTSVSVTNMGLYDADSDEDIMHTSNSGALIVQGASNSYTGESLSILAQNTLTVTSASSETINTEKINNAGTITSVGSPTYTLTGTSGTLFTLSGVFTPATSEVIVTSASGTPTLLSSGTTFHRLTINADATVINAGSTITMSSADASNRLYVQKGVLNDGGNQITGTANGTLIVNVGASLCIGGTSTATTATCDSGATPTSATTFPTNYTNGNITLTGGGWYDSLWGYRNSLTIDYTKVQSADQTNFPVMINTTNANWKVVASGGHVGKSDGTDILFTSSDGTTKLDHEIEKYTSTTGELIAWVRIPTLSYTSNTTIYVYYGNAAASAQANATGVWNSAYQGVYHLSDGTTLSATDSTSNANNGTKVNTPTATTGKIDGGANFVRSSNQDITLGSSSTLSIQDVMTVETWVKFNSNYSSAQAVIGNYKDLASDLSNYALEFGRTPNRFNMYFIGGTTGYILGTNNTSISDNNWHHIAAVRSGSSGSWTWTYYLDGVADGTASTAVNADGGTSVPTSLAAYGNYVTGTTQLEGNLDESRISNAVRDANWIKTGYNNQSSPSTFYAVGSETSSSSSTVYYNADATTTVSSTPTYGNLVFKPVLTADRAYTLGSSLTVSGAFDSNPNGGSVARVLTGTLGGALTVTGATTLGGTSSGVTTLNTSGSNYAVSTSGLTIASGSTMTANGSTITLTGSGTAFGNSGTFTGSTSTIKLTDATSTDKTFAGGGATFGTLQLTGAGTGAFIITGSNTFNQFLVDTPPHTVKFTAGTTQTVTDWNVFGSSGNLMTLNSTSNGTKWNLYLAPPHHGYGVYSSEFLSIRDSAVTGNSYFSSIYTGGSTDDTTGGSTNTGWTFSFRSRGGGGGGVESSATPDAGVGGGGQNGGGEVESGGNPDAGQGGGGQGGGGDLGLLNRYRGSMLASVGSLNLFSILKRIFF